MSQALQRDPHLIPISDRPRLGYFTPSRMDAVFVFVTFFGLWTLLDALPSLPFWAPQLVPLVLVAVLIYRLEDGRIYYVYGYLAPSGFWIWNKRGVLWETHEESPLKTRRIKSARLEKALEERRAAIKFKVDGIDLGDRTLGILHNTKTRLDTFVIVGDGSPYVMQEVMAQLNAVDLHGEVIKRNAITPEFKVRWSYVFRRSPDDPFEILKTYHHSLQGTVYFPPARLKPESDWTVEDQVDLFLNGVAKASLEDSEALSSDVTMAVVVTIERKGSLYEQKRTKELAEDEFARQPVLELESGIVSDLANIAGVQNPRSLTEDELRKFVRQTWDVTDIQEYYRRFHEDQRGALTEEGRESFLMSHWPSKLIWVGAGESQLDDTHHAVIKVTSNPSEIPPDFWHRIMKVRYTRQAKPIWTAVTFCGETVSLKGEAFALSRLIPFTRVLRTAVMNSTYQSAKSIERDQSMVERHTTIYRDQNYQLANMRLIHIRAQDRASLREALRVMKDQLARNRVKGRVIKRRALQLRAIWSSAGIPLL